MTTKQQKEFLATKLTPGQLISEYRRIAVGIASKENVGDTEAENLAILGAELLRRQA